MPVKIIKAQEVFRCNVCKTEYETQKDAVECEKRSLETIKFNVGDRAQNTFEPRECSSGGGLYQFAGRVIEIKGPVPSDYEYEVKWLGAKPDRLNAHVFEYIVEYRCPICRRIKTAIYYAPELEKII